jgi:hypothetical protein
MDTVQLFVLGILIFSVGCLVGGWVMVWTQTKRRNLKDEFLSECGLLTQKRNLEWEFLGWCLRKYPREFRRHVY